MLLLRRIEGLPSREVATLLGRTDAAIRKTLSRAVARLTMDLRDDTTRGDEVPRP